MPWLSLYQHKDIPFVLKFGNANRPASEPPPENLLQDGHNDPCGWVYEPSYWLSCIVGDHLAFQTACFFILSSFLPHLVEILIWEPVGSLLASISVYIWYTLISSGEEQILEAGPNIFNVVVQKAAVPRDLTNEASKMVELGCLKVVGGVAVSG